MNDDDGSDNNKNNKRIRIGQKRFVTWRIKTISSHHLNDTRTRKNEHTHRISTPYAALRCTIHALYCSYVGGDAHVASTWQTFTLLVRIRCQWRRTALYTCTFYTRDMNILLMSRYHQQPSHTQLMVCSNLCKHNNLAATVLSKTSVKQPEKNPDLLKYGTIFAKPKN